MMIPRGAASLPRKSTLGLIFTVAAFVLILAPACSREKADSQEPHAAEMAAHPAAAPESPAPKGPIPINVGDVESGIQVKATIAPENKAANVAVDEMTTARSQMVMCTVTVSPPYPEHLPVTFTVTASRDFLERVVVLQGNGLRDDAPLEPRYSAVVSARTAPEGEKYTRTFTVDVMQGLSAAPKTMLVNAKLDALLMPALADLEKLDPATAQSTDKTVIFSNPVRINFVEAAQ